MAKVFLSEYNWTPGADAADYAWEPGEICIARSRHDPNKTARVRMLNGEKKTHRSVPDGFVFEVRFLDGSGTHAIDSRCIEPSDERRARIAAGRAGAGALNVDPALNEWTSLLRESLEARSRVDAWLKDFPPPSFWGFSADEWAFMHMPFFDRLTPCKKLNSV